MIFSGHIRFSEILAYYKTADLFLCMSEHEGFCVPIVEAMYFGLPIVALRSTAVTDTLGDGGILLPELPLRPGRKHIRGAAALPGGLPPAGMRRQGRHGQRKPLHHAKRHGFDRRQRVHIQQIPDLHRNRRRSYQHTDQYLGIGQRYVVEVYDSTARSFSPLPIMEEKNT